MHRRPIPYVWSGSIVDTFPTSNLSHEPDQVGQLSGLEKMILSDSDKSRNATYQNLVNIIRMPDGVILTSVRSSSCHYFRFSWFKTKNLSWFLIISKIKRAERVKEEVYDISWWAISWFTLNVPKKVILTLYLVGKKIYKLLFGIFNSD